MDEIKQALKKGKERLQPWNQLLDVKQAEDDIDGLLAKVDKLRERAPRDLGPELQAWLDELRGALQSRVTAQNAAFKKLEVEFLNSLQKENVPTTELNQGWRVGSLANQPTGFWDRGVLDLQFKRESALISIAYNEAVLVKNRRVRKPADFKQAAEAAYAELKKYGAKVIPDQELGELLWQAFEEGREQARESFVSLRLVARLFRVRLLLQRLGKDGFEGSDPMPDLTGWGLSHLLDRYALLGQSLPPQKRLLFEPGSQETIRKGLGVTVTHHHNQKVVCFVRAAN